MESSKRCPNRLTAVAALVAAVAMQGVAVAQEKKPLTFAIIQSEEMSQLGARWDSTLKYVAKQVGTDVNFYATNSYAAVVEGMLSGFVHIGKLGANIYIVAEKKSGGTIVPIVAAARPANMFSPEPCACYHATLITKKGSGLNTLASLKGKTVALVEPASTSGSTLPRVLFPKEINGVKLEDYFGRVFYSGSHSASALAVHSGKADAAFVSESTLERVLTQRNIAKDELVYLWRSPRIPIDVVTVNTKYVSPEMVKKLQAAFNGMKDTEEGRKILKDTKYAEFSIAKDSDFEDLRRILAFEEETKPK
jgi:phosphonate transport system substrate-binding protein